MDFGDFISEMERRRHVASVALEAGVEVKRTGTLLLASQYGVFDFLWLIRFTRPNGRPDYRCISEAPASRWHICQVPAYVDISAAVDDLTTDGNAAHRLRAMGVVVADKSVKRLSRHIRGTMRAIWLAHLWSGHAVTELRTKFYHPSDVKPYWAEAWRMHGDGTHLADAMAWLHALCAEYHRRAGKPHAGAAFVKASQTLINRRAMESA